MSEEILHSNWEMNLVGKNKKEIQVQAEQDMQAFIEEGLHDVRPLILRLKRMSEYAEACMKAAKEEAIKELSKEDYNQFELDNMRMTISHSGGRINYHEAAIWREVNEEKKIVEEGIKARLKGVTGVDRNGEEYPVCSKKESTETITISFK